MIFFDRINRFYKTVKKVLNESFKVELSSTLYDHNVDITKPFIRLFTLLFLFVILTSGFASYYSVKHQILKSKHQKKIEHFQAELSACALQSAQAKFNLKRCKENKPKIDILEQFINKQEENINGQR